MININALFLFFLVLAAIFIFLNQEYLKKLLRNAIFPNKSKDGKYVKVCPKCGSAKIQVDFSNPVVWDYGTPPKYRCKSCGYISSTFPEILEEKSKQYRTELKAQIKEGKLRAKKEELVDTSTGFYAGVWEVIVGLFLLPVLLILLIAYFVKDPYGLGIFLKENSGIIVTSLLGTIFLAYILLKTVNYARDRSL